MADRRWTEPQGTPAPFTLLNSLTNAVGPFVPVSPGRVGWYACGPTVYDSAHMGHARAYVTFDIVRRIIEDFFGYEVFYVMNITDIEDKIILRARKNHLFAEFLKGIGSSRDKLIPVALDALRRRDEKQMKKVEVLRRKCEEVENKRQKKELQEQLSGEMSKLELYSEEHKSFLELEADKSSSFQSLVKQCQDAVSSVLDAEHGHEIDDHGIFGALSSKYEKEFLEDMNTLGVKEPDVLTRVTEYVPQIVGFISKIIEKGFAYESKGSVYFDTHKFLAAGHTYPKLKPWAGGSSELVAEGEGALSDGLEKKSDVDFALWKASRKGEPTWDSPWGPGRPGWHIECSVMASDVLGSTFDIHSGGEDLMFPHHDNEIAQSEAHFDIHQWVNYFMHAGHLSIRGLKMSKSLKNFVSIRDALEMHSPRQIRILFLLQAWDKTMIYGDQSVKEALAKEKTIKEFFLQLQVLFRKDLSGPQFWLEEDRQLHRVLSETQDSVRKHLSDNFDYPQAFNDIIGRCFLPFVLSRVRVDFKV
jgi:cysteinyl-tRNA synthetase